MKASRCYRRHPCVVGIGLMVLAGVSTVAKAASAPCCRAQSMAFIGTIASNPSSPSRSFDQKLVHRIALSSPSPAISPPFKRQHQQLQQSTRDRLSTVRYFGPLGNGVVQSMGGITEMQLIARLMMATAAGALIGFERRYSERPAGLRTMAMVSLGAAIFTIISLGLPGDKSRLAASVASGVGFIGAGVISQNAVEDSKGSGRYRVQQINGLTTATAIWVSAALGVSSGAGLHLLTICGTILAVCVLRVGRLTRLLRIRRRDFQRFMGQSDRLKALVGNTASSSNSTSSSSTSTNTTTTPPVTAASGPFKPSSSSSLTSPPSPNNKKNLAAAAAAATAAAAPLGAGPVALATAAAAAILTEETDEYNGPLGPSAIAGGMPPTSDLYETTSPMGLGSQDLDFGSMDGGGSGGGEGGISFAATAGGEGLNETSFADSANGMSFGFDGNGL